MYGWKGKVREYGKHYEGSPSPLLRFPWKKIQRGWSFLHLSLEASSTITLYAYTIFEKFEYFVNLTKQQQLQCGVIQKWQILLTTPRNQNICVSFETSKLSLEFSTSNIAIVEIKLFIIEKGWLNSEYIQVGERERERA